MLSSLFSATPLLLLFFLLLLLIYLQLPAVNTEEPLFSQQHMKIIYQANFTAENQETPEIERHFHFKKGFTLWVM